MRIVKYKTLLDEAGLATLVKDRSFNYPEERLSNPYQIAQMLRDAFQLHKETEEYLYLLCFNSKMKLNGVFEMTHGTVNMSLASTREMFQKALLCNAANIVIAHNHPSQVVEPSKEDIAITQKVKEAGNLMSVPLIDSLIIGNHSYFSFNEQNMI